MVCLSSLLRVSVLMKLSGFSGLFLHRNVVLFYCLEHSALILLFLARLVESTRSLKLHVSFVSYLSFLCSAPEVED